MKNNFLILLLCAAFVALYTYTGLEDKPVRIITPEQSVDGVQALTDSIDGHYRLELSRLESENDSFRTLIGSDRRTLDVSKKKVSFLQQKVLLLSQQLNVTADTSLKLGLCDSLREKVSVLVTESVARDSICDKTVGELTLLAQVQDSSLEICKDSYILIKRNLDASLRQQEDLSGRLSLTEKKLRHRTRLNRWLAGGLTVASGILVSFFLLH